MGIDGCEEVPSLPLQCRWCLTWYSSDLRKMGVALTIGMERVMPCCCSGSILWTCFQGLFLFLFFSSLLFSLSSLIFNFIYFFNFFFGISDLNVQLPSENRQDSCRDSSVVWILLCSQLSKYWLIVIESCNKLSGLLSGRHLGKRGCGVSTNRQKGSEEEENGHALWRRLIA